MDQGSASAKPRIQFLIKNAQALKLDRKQHLHDRPLVDDSFGIRPQKDKFGNTVYISCSSWENLGSGIIAPSMLVASPRGRVLIKKNPGLLRKIQEGYPEMGSMSSGFEADVVKVNISDGGNNESPYVVKFIYPVVNHKREGKALYTSGIDHMRAMQSLEVRYFNFHFATPVVATHNVAVAPFIKNSFLLRFVKTLRDNPVPTQLFQNELAQEITAEDKNLLVLILDLEQHRFHRYARWFVEGVKQSLAKMKQEFKETQGFESFNRLRVDVNDTNIMVDTTAFIANYFRFSIAMGYESLLYIMWEKHARAKAMTWQANPENKLQKYDGTQESKSAIKDGLISFYENSCTVLEAVISDHELVQ